MGILDFNMPDNKDDVKPSDGAENEEGQDFEEFSEEECNALEAEIDKINSALDSIEQRNDYINTQLKQILEENKRARQIEETNSSQSPEKGDS